MSDSPKDFQRGLTEKRRGFLAEFWDYLRFSKKWWMIPILVLVLGLGLFVLLTATGLAPFIYTLF